MIYDILNAEIPNPYYNKKVLQEFTAQDII
jgi:hypothetical protein